jgi:parallel beta-helix repeat protein
MGSVIASANRIGNGFEVRNCTIGPNRSRGILVKASDGIISGNTLVGNRLDAIKLSPEYVWLEAGSGSNVTISDNLISGCYSAAIAVSAYGGNGETAPEGAHRNIAVTGNTISGSTNPAIALTSIRGLFLENNTIESPNNNLLVPWIMNDYGRNEDPSREIYLKNVVAEADQVGMQEKISMQSLGIAIANNPFTDQIRLELKTPLDIAYVIYNLKGAKVFSSTTAIQPVIPTSDWNTGFYILAIDGVAAVLLLKW